ncbi:MAG: S8 family peptidase [Anaerolineae bacterium]|nr:S8 family peptidase [Anaerolineae bacterium]
MMIKRNSKILVVLIICSLLISTSAVQRVYSSPSHNVRVLVRFVSEPDRQDEALIKIAGGQVKYRYSIVNAIAATLPESALLRLQEHPRIARIEYDSLMHAVDIELDNAWGVSHIEAGVVHETIGNLGEGVNIAIIDSGINRFHPDLDANYAGGFDFIENDGEPQDIYGHGTHVAGIACAEDNDNGDETGPYGVVGVAPMCNLYALKVLDDNGWGYSSTLIEALDWAIANNIQVANLSLGWDMDPGETVEEAFTAAEQAGIVVVAAACNNGKKSGRGENVCWPGKYASVIAVAATDSNDTRATFSSTGSEVELAAPGVSVLSTWNDDTGYSLPDPVCRLPDGVDCYKYGSGTSMASPHVAGTAALVIKSGLLDANGNGRINDEVRQQLIDTSVDLGLPGWDTWYGFGLVNAWSAVSTELPPDPGEDMQIFSVAPEQVPANEVSILTILGSGFTEDTTVNFTGDKGTPPIVKSVAVNETGSLLTVEVLTKRTPKTTYWTIIVSNPNGDSDILLDAISVVP